MARVYNNVKDLGGEAAAGGGGGRRHIRDKPSGGRGRNHSGPERCSPCPQPSQVNRPPPRQARGTRPPHQLVGNAGGALARSASAAAAAAPAAAPAAAAAAAAPPRPGNNDWIGLFLGNSRSLGVLCFSVFYKQWNFSLSYSPRN